MPFEPLEEQPALFADINKLQAPRKAIARLADTDETMLARAASGTRSMSYVEFRPVRKTVDDLLVLKDRSAGIPIDWSDIRSLRKLLADLDEERMNPPKPLTPQESETLAKFTAGSDVGDLAIDAQMSKAEFLSYVEELLSRSIRIAALAKQQVAV